MSSRPTRQEIIAKMNYRFPSGQDDDEEYNQGFYDGLREILGKALKIPQSDYDVHFNDDDERLYDMRWYLRCDRIALANTLAPEMRQSIIDSCNRIKQLYPEIDTYLDQDTQKRWGKLAGEHAAIRWLQDPDRTAADEIFPCCDT